MNGPRGGETELVKNGSLTHGKPKYKGKVGSRQLVENPNTGRLSEETKELIDKLFLERLPQAAIARVTGVSEPWWQSYVNPPSEALPKEVEVSKTSKGRLTVECEEDWSSVGNQDNKPWIWLAIDRDTGEIVGVAVGDRSRKTAAPLWNSLPGVERPCAVSYTEFGEASSAVLPSGRHRAVGKETGQTKPIERFNGTFRPRVSRVVRKTGSFSPKLSNHIGAIWYVIPHDNATLLA